MDRFRTAPNRRLEIPDDSSRCSSPRTGGSTPSSPAQSPGLRRSSVTVGGMHSPRLLRQLAKKLWQPDREADSCSIIACDNEFGNSLLSPRRHHCRSCGRVICARCSTGTMTMLPPKGETGPAKRVRVCDACFQQDDPFHLSIPDGSEKKAISSSLSFMKLLRRTSMSELPSHLAAPAANRQDLNSPKGTDAAVQGAPLSPAGSQKQEPNGAELKRNLRQSCSAPDLAILSKMGHRQKVKNTETTEPNSLEKSAEDLKYDSDSISKAETLNTGSQGSWSETQAEPKVDMTSCPMYIKPRAQRSISPSEDNLLEGLEQTEQLQRLQQAFAESSFYDGLRAHEPRALRELLVAAASERRAHASQ